MFFTSSALECQNFASLLRTGVMAICFTAKPKYHWYGYFIFSWAYFTNELAGVLSHCAMQ